jgi:hypothetical protein
MRLWKNAVNLVIKWGNDILNWMLFCNSVPKFTIPLYYSLQIPKQINIYYQTTFNPLTFKKRASYI